MCALCAITLSCVNVNTKVVLPERSNFRIINFYFFQYSKSIPLFPLMKHYNSLTISSENGAFLLKNMNYFVIFVISVWTNAQMTMTSFWYASYLRASMSCSRLSPNFAVCCDSVEERNLILCPRHLSHTSTIIQWVVLLSKPRLTIEEWMNLYCKECTFTHSILWLPSFKGEYFVTNHINRNDVRVYIHRRRGSIFKHLKPTSWWTSHRSKIPPWFWKGMNRIWQNQVQHRNENTI